MEEQSAHWHRRTRKEDKLTSYKFVKSLLR